MSTQISIEEQAAANVRKLLTELFSTPRNLQIDEPYKGILAIADFSGIEMGPEMNDLQDLKLEANQMLLNGGKEAIEKAASALKTLDIKHKKDLHYNSSTYYIVLDKNDANFKALNQLATEALKEKSAPLEGLINQYMIRNDSWLDRASEMASSTKTR